jgi:hypothetical protein
MIRLNLTRIHLVNSATPRYYPAFARLLILYMAMYAICEVIEKRKTKFEIAGK